MIVTLPSVVEVGAHRLPLVIPHPIRQLRFVQGWPSGEDDQLRHNFAALAVCWDPTAGAPPWPVEADTLAQGDAVAVVLARWVGALPAFKIASAVSTALYALASPPDEAEVEPIAVFSEAPDPGRSVGTSSPTGTSETHSPGTD